MVSRMQHLVRLSCFRLCLPAWLSFQVIFVSLKTRRYSMNNKKWQWKWYFVSHFLWRSSLCNLRKLLQTRVALHHWMDRFKNRIQLVSMFHTVLYELPLRTMWKSPGFTRGNPRKTWFQVPFGLKCHGLPIWNSPRSSRTFPLAKQARNWECTYLIGYCCDDSGGSKVQRVGGLEDCLLGLVWTLDSLFNHYVSKANIWSNMYKQTNNASLWFQ